MKNYKGKFTKDQLKRLEEFYTSNDPERRLSEDLTMNFWELFEDERPEQPAEGFDNETDFDNWLMERFDEYLIDVLSNKMATTEDLEKAMRTRLKTGEARIIYNRDNFLAILTNKESGSGKHQRRINGQLEYKVTENGELSIFDDNGNPVVTEIKEQKRYIRLDVGLLYAVLTGVIENYNQGYRGKFRIQRRRFEEYMKLSLPIPSEEILDFITRGGMEVPEEQIEEPKDKALRGKIEKHYINWVDIHNLDRAGMRATSSGKILKILNFYGYDPKADDIILESPYCEEEARCLEEQKIFIEEKNDKPIYRLPISKHIKGSINSVRNNATKETVYIIEERLSQIKKVPVADKNYKYKGKKNIRLDIGYSDLIKNNNSLSWQLNSNNPKKRGDILKRAIFGTKDYYRSRTTVRDGEAEEYKTKIPFLEYVIREHTVFYDCYFNFKIVCDPIKLTEIKKHPLKYGIHITFDALNGDYAEKPTLTAPEVEIV